MEAFVQAMSAGSGGVAATVSLFPLDTIKTRMQARKANADANGGGVGETVVGIMEDGGPMAFFAGVRPGAVQSAIEKFVYFYAYTLLKAGWKSATGEAPGTISNLAIGYVSEWCHLPITLPLERVVKTIQTTRKEEEKVLPEPMVVNNSNVAAADGGAGDGGAGPPPSLTTAAAAVSTAAAMTAPAASSCSGAAPGVLATVEKKTPSSP